MNTRVIVSFLAAGLLCVGCAKQSIDPAQVRAAFAEDKRDEVKQLVDQSMKLVETSNYVAAIQPLQLLGFKYKLDKPERKVLADTIQKLQTKAGK